MVHTGSSPTPEQSAFEILLGLVEYLTDAPDYEVGDVWREYPEWRTWVEHLMGPWLLEHLPEDPYEALKVIRPWLTEYQAKRAAAREEAERGSQT